MFFANDAKLCSKKSLKQPKLQKEEEGEEEEEEEA